jgi:hypothetical protein
MDLEEAMSVIGNKADLRTSEGWLVHVRILSAKSSYGNIRFEVEGDGKIAVVDHTRIVAIYTSDAHCKECYEQEREETAWFTEQEAQSAARKVVRDNLEIPTKV